MDYEGKAVAEGAVQDGRVGLGRLPVGYYEVVRGTDNASNRISIGVLGKLRAATPKTSPIGIDVAAAWFFQKDRLGAVANLSALAGMNRVRDRLSWGNWEPRRGEFATTSRYDWSAQAQAAAGLQVLEVNHHSPAWANPNGKRFPLDLRDTYNFYRAMASRWRGQVEAFEPWNEADIGMFGGHTGSEMASLQKAAWLGLKAGNPKVIGCLNVFAIHRPATLRDFRENEAWPYFDTFNLHHYEPFDAYPRLYADFRAVSAGKPLWVTECSVPVKWQGDEGRKEPSEGALRVQSERVVKTYAQSIHEGAQAVFYFMLPHYVEGQTQFGLLRPDLTPRPGYLALAAAGRLLADAKPLGRLEVGTNPIHGFLFQAKPDGKSAHVLVIWSDHEDSLTLPQPPTACFDHLGRPRVFSGNALSLSAAPRFVLLSAGTRLPLVRPPPSPPLLKDEPSPLLLQAVLPEESYFLNQSAYKLPPGQTNTIPVFVYNFGEKKAAGRFTTVLAMESSKPALADSWDVAFPGQVEVAPGKRKELALRLTCPGTNDSRMATIRVTGDFGSAGKPLLSLRVVAR